MMGDETEGGNLVVIIIERGLSRSGGPASRVTVCHTALRHSWDGVQGPRRMRSGYGCPRGMACLVLISPKILKPPRRQFGIFHGMLNVPMPQIELDRARILFRIGQLIPTPMPEL